MASERQLSAVLSEFARTMVTDYPIQDILEHLVQRIVEMLPITAAGVTLISANASPRYVASSDESALRYERLQTALDEGPCLAAYRTGKAVVVSDLRADARFEVFRPRALEAGLGAVFTFPLRQDDKRLGALDLYRETPGSLSDSEMRTAQTLADVTAAYLVNAEVRAELQASSSRFRESAVHDALTGMPNRILLLERLEHALLRGRRSRKLIAVLYADLDQFKSVNDMHGHRAGDDLLVAVAERLTSLLRPGDTLARMSGDEFVILCEELDEPQQAERIAARIVAALAVPFELSGIEVGISASIGVAFAGRGDHVPEQLLHDADTAMYQAKRRGGDHHQVIDLREQRVAEHRTILQRDLRSALRRGELRAEYQPIVRTADAAIVGAEALLRWDHPVHGLVPPAISVPLAEKSGLIVDIGRWMLQQACTDRHRWAGHAGHEDIGMAVNVSSHQLMAPNFVRTVASVLTATDTRPELLTLEITESVFVQDSERALLVLRDLKRLGVLLALDDFGTGYSSLSYLKRFPVDVVKIDQGFVADLVRDRASHAIVSKVIELAHLLGLAVVTEGVETAEQHRRVAKLGSQSCQGFYFARPMSAVSFDLLAGRGRHALDIPVPLLTFVSVPPGLGPIAGGRAHP